MLSYNDIAYGQSLGTTAKFPRDSIAFKWRDEIKETTLKEIEWSASRTGLINPVAVFEPVELEGTTVSRASVHNISVMRELKLGIGDTIKVYKANMIIPQVAENLTGSNNVELPSTTKNNIDALETIVNYAMDKDIPYFAINIPNDMCTKCGYTDDINEK